MPRVGYRLAALAAVIVLLVAGCGGVGREPERPEAGQGTLSTFGFSLQNEIATTRVDAFKKANPQVQVKVTEGGFDEQQSLSAWTAPATSSCSGGSRCR